MKSVLCVIMLLFFVSGGKAQLVRQYGVKVAYTSAAQSFNYYAAGFEINNKRRPGINAAVFIEWLNVPFLSFVSQLEYAQRGMGMEFARTAIDPTVLSTYVEYHRVDYLSIPLMAKLSLPSPVVQPYIIAGPRIDFPLAYHGNDANLGSIYRDFRSPNLGGSVGAGVSVSSILPIAAFVEFRYNVDLTTPFDNGALRITNNAYDIWLGVSH